MMCERILLRNLFLFVAAAAYSQYMGCWVNIFSSANYIMLTSLDKYFSTTIFSGRILDGSLSPAWQFGHAVLEHDDFLKTYFTR